MSFWRLAHTVSQVAVIDEALQCRISYSRLHEEVDGFIAAVPSAKSKKLGFILCRNTVAPLIAYLAALRDKVAVCLLNAAIDAGVLEQLAEAYLPSWIVAPTGAGALPGYGDAASNLKGLGYRLLARQSDVEPPVSAVHPDLALLLSTSGTTGSPKMVRLSYRNLQANAESIASYLNLDASERAITSLPMQYSYGLSVINSHLHAGATILLTDRSLMTKEFWNFLKAELATSLAGVPFTYRVLHRIKFPEMALPGMRTLTQAGGHLDIELVKYFHDCADRKGMRTFIMYGQTEATARISYVPPELLRSKYGSIGIPIPNGSLSLDELTQELIYRGPNVMMGYAESAGDLGRGDDCEGVLHTGDIARRDEDGYYYLTGRINRFLKLFGLRVNLDDIEQLLANRLSSPVMCLGQDERLLIYLEEESGRRLAKEILTGTYQLHHSSFQIRIIDRIPHTTSGKMDYLKLTEMSAR